MNGGSQSTVADFYFLERLGRGNSGTVFKVKRKADSKFYVIKQVDIAAVTKEEQDEAINECLLLASMDSPYVIRYYDSFIDDDLLNIVMEWGQGGTLQDAIKTSASGLPRDTIWKWFVQISIGLKHIHERKVLHRDLKSMNVFLDAESNAKIGDLGVAKMLGTRGEYANTVVGTPFYLSPELCEGKPYNEKSDVWALGVLLYEMCTTGNLPFEANNQGALIMKILKGRYEPLRSSKSQEFSEIIRLCLTRTVNQRPKLQDIMARQEFLEAAARLGMDVPGFPSRRPRTNRRASGHAPSLSQLDEECGSGFGSSGELTRRSGEEEPQQSSRGSRTSRSHIPDFNSSDLFSGPQVGAATSHASSSNSGVTMGKPLEGERKRMPWERSTTTSRDGAGAASMAGRAIPAPTSSVSEVQPQSSSVDHEMSIAQRRRAGRRNQGVYRSLDEQAMKFSQRSGRGAPGNGVRGESLSSLGVTSPPILGKGRLNAVKEEFGVAAASPVGAGSGVMHQLVNDTFGESGRGSMFGGVSGVSQSHVIGQSLSNLSLEGEAASAGDAFAARRAMAGGGQGLMPPASPLDQLVRNKFGAATGATGAPNLNAAQSGLGGHAAGGVQAVGNRRGKLRTVNEHEIGSSNVAVRHYNSLSPDRFSGSLSSTGTSTGSSASSVDHYHGALQQNQTAAEDLLVAPKRLDL